MAKGSNSSKKAATFVKGKVTPVEVALIVDRYLEENHYTDALSAFRSEASDLFSKTKGKEVPKGLLGLGDILDEYIRLKEQKVMVDCEKQRLEMVFQGLENVIQAYHSPSPPILSPQFVGTPAAPFSPTSNPTNGSPPVPISSSVSKRKASKSAPKGPPAPKKPCKQSSRNSRFVGDIVLSSKVRCTNNTDCNPENHSVPSTSINPVITSSVQRSSVAKSLLKQPPESRAKSSSPKTPPQALPSQTDKSVSPFKNSSFNGSDSNTLQKIVSSSFSIISSETIIVSPLKYKDHYAVERGYHVTSSPLKPNADELRKRDHVKGRLDFGPSDVPMNAEKPVACESSPPSTDGEASESFDFDIPDLDIFDGDFFSKFMSELDIDCDTPCQPASALIQGQFRAKCRQRIVGNKSTCTGVLSVHSNWCYF